MLLTSPACYLASTIITAAMLTRQLRLLPAAAPAISTGGIDPMEHAN